MKQVSVIEGDQVLSLCITEFLKVQGFNVANAWDGTKSSGLPWKRKLDPLS